MSVTPLSVVIVGTKSAGFIEISFPVQLLVCLFSSGVNEIVAAALVIS